MYLTKENIIFIFCIIFCIIKYNSLMLSRNIQTFIKTTKAAFSFVRIRSVLDSFHSSVPISVFPGILFYVARSEAENHCSHFLNCYQVCYIKHLYKWQNRIHFSLNITQVVPFVIVCTMHEGTY